MAALEADVHYKELPWRPCSDTPPPLIVRREETMRRRVSSSEAIVPYRKPISFRTNLPPLNFSFHHKLHSKNKQARKNFRISAGFRLLKAPVTLWLRNTLGWEQAQSADIVDVIAYLEQSDGGMRSKRAQTAPSKAASFDP